MKKIYWILLLAFVLRLINLNQSLWLDEGIQWWASTTFPLKHLVTEYIKGDFNPPLFHTILYYLTKLFGTTEIALRFPSVIFGTLTVLFTYKIAQLTIKKYAATAALLTATAPLLIYYSQEARMYALSAFTATAAIYYLLKINKSKNLPFSIFYVLFLISMLYSHYLTWLLIPLLLFFQPLLTSIGLLFLIPWLPIFISQLNQGLATASVNPIWGNVVGSLSIKNISLIPVKFLIGRISVDNNIIFASLLIIPLLFIFYLLFKSLKKSAPVKIIWYWLLLPILIAIIISIKIPLLSYFRFLFILPAFYILLAHAISVSPNKHQKKYILALILINILSSSIYLLNSNFHRENWKKATQYVHQFESPVLINSAVTSPFEYYDQNQTLLITEKNLDELKNLSTVIYIPYAQPIFDPQDSFLNTLKKLGFTQDSKKHFRGVTVILHKIKQ